MDNFTDAPQDQRQQDLSRVLIQRFEDMRGGRASWESHWEELARYVYPRREGFVGSVTPGSKRGQFMYDSTPTVALELLASALQSMLTNPATPWFGLDFYIGGVKLSDDKTLGDKGKEVKSWGDSCTSTMHDFFRNTNFHTQTHELYLDIGMLGTAAMFIAEDDETHLNFDTRHLSEIYIAHDMRELVDTVCRKFKYTARQMAQKFGLGNVPAAVRLAYEKNPEDKFEVLHAVFPNDDFLATKVKAGANMPVASVYVDVASRRVLDEGGFHEMPWVVPRWEVASGEVFGRSQAMACLPDVKTLHLVQQGLIRAQQMALQPPILAPDDSFMGKVQATPGRIIYYRNSNPGDKIMAWPQGSKFEVAIQEKEALRDSIRKAFFIDQLQLRQGPQMTATEVMARTEEQQRLMGPVLGRMHREFLNPLIRRVFGILSRRGVLPPPPAVLAEMGKRVQIKAQYVSPIAKAMNTYQGQAILKLLSTLAPFASYDPTVMDNIDMDLTAGRLGDIYGVPTDLMRSDKAKAQMRDDRRAQESQMRNAQIAEMQASAASKVMPQQPAGASPNMFPML